MGSGQSSQSSAKKHVKKDYESGVAAESGRKFESYHLPFSKKKKPSKFSSRILRSKKDNRDLSSLPSLLPNNFQAYSQVKPKISNSISTDALSSREVGRVRRNEFGFDVADEDDFSEFSGTKITPFGADKICKVLPEENIYSNDIRDQDFPSTNTVETDVRTEKVPTDTIQAEEVQTAKIKTEEVSARVIQTEKSQTEPVRVEIAEAQVPNPEAQEVQPQNVQTPEVQAQNAQAHKDQTQNEQAQEVQASDSQTKKVQPENIKVEERNSDEVRAALKPELIKPRLSQDSSSEEKSSNSIFVDASEDPLCSDNEKPIPKEVEVPKKKKTLKNRTNILKKSFGKIKGTAAAAGQSKPASVEQQKPEEKLNKNKREKKKNAKSVAVDLKCEEKPASTLNAVMNNNRSSAFTALNASANTEAPLVDRRNKPTGRRITSKIIEPNLEAIQPEADSIGKPKNILKVQKRKPLNQQVFDTNPPNEIDNVEQLNLQLEPRNNLIDIEATTKTELKTSDIRNVQLPGSNVALTHEIQSNNIKLEENANPAQTESTKALSNNANISSKHAFNESNDTYKNKCATSNLVTKSVENNEHSDADKAVVYYNFVKSDPSNKTTQIESCSHPEAPDLAAKETKFNRGFVDFTAIKFCANNNDNKEAPVNPNQNDFAVTPTQTKKIVNENKAVAAATKPCIRNHPSIKPTRQADIVLEELNKKYSEAANDLSSMLTNSSHEDFLATFKELLAPEAQTSHSTISASAKEPQPLIEKQKPVKNETEKKDYNNEGKQILEEINLPEKEREKGGEEEPINDLEQPGHILEEAAQALEETRRQSLEDAIEFLDETRQSPDENRREAELKSDSDEKESSSCSSSYDKNLLHEVVTSSSGSNTSDMAESVWDDDDTSRRLYASANEIKTQLVEDLMKSSEVNLGDFQQFLELDVSFTQKYHYLPFDELLRNNIKAGNTLDALGRCFRVLAKYGLDLMKTDPERQQFSRKILIKDTFLENSCLAMPGVLDVLKGFGYEERDDCLIFVDNLDTEPIALAVWIIEILLAAHELNFYHLGIHPQPKLFQPYFEPVDQQQVV